MNYYPKVSIIIPTAIVPKIMQSCLHSISMLDYPQKYIEVIIVSNAAPQILLQKLVKKYPGVKIVYFAKNHSFAKAINTGFQQANGQYICIANDDVIFEKQSIKYLVSNLIKHPRVGICGPVINKNKASHSYGYVINYWTGVVRSVNKNLSDNTTWLQGCCLVMNKELFLRLQGFDENFDHYFEDADLCLRTKKIGYDMKCISDAHIVHQDSTTTNQNLPRKYYLWYKNKIRLMFKHFSSAQIFVNSVMHFCLFIFYLFTFNQRSFALLKASLWSFIKLPQLINNRYAS